MLTNYIHSLVFLTAVSFSLFSSPTLGDGPNGEQCGSANGGASCGLNTCCSSAGYCGTTSDFCGTGCQAQFGSCVVPTAPSCNPSDGSATNGRKVGYWLVQQTHDRTCDNIKPADIVTNGLTHIILSFAHIDQSTFAVVPANQDDVQYYTQFTNLKSSSLQTWIAIGGGGFSTAIWKAATATESSRAAFVSSLQTFVTQYGFQGVDLDWEFPAADGSDAQNFVALTKMIKDTIGIPISAAVPADWGSVRGFDLDGLSNYVDWFNYMAYDIHGWDIDQPPRKSSVSYPADIRDINTDLLPVWANATNPRQINLGIPLYGRGYTLASSTCTEVGCAATGANSPGQCAADPGGVLTLDDFQSAIQNNAVSIALDQDALQKRATWGSNQWLGYDDGDTIQLKTSWADGHCLGGTFFFSLDFDARGVSTVPKPTK